MNRKCLLRNIAILVILGLLVLFGCGEEEAGEESAGSYWPLEARGVTKPVKRFQESNFEGSLHEHFENRSIVGEFIIPAVIDERVGFQIVP